jgi:ubiquitin carboxyl-terminal hydrolase L5
MSHNTYSTANATAARKPAEVEKQAPTQSSSTDGISSAGKQKQSPSADTPAGHTSSANVSPQSDKLSSKKRALPEPSTEAEPSTKKTKAPTLMAKKDKDISSTSDAPTEKALCTAVNVRNDKASAPAPDDQNEASSPASDVKNDNKFTTLNVKISKENWQGFCEIESDPSAFSVILREMGVKDVAVREVLAMDPAILDTIPQPIYGLIFLFRYRELGNEDQAADTADDVWFCNQLPAQNSCGTLAMLNIIMNNPDLDIGEHLTQFKNFTQDMSSVLRGEALASFDFVKQIHNSFAKRMDILENDKHLAAKAKRAQAEKKPKKASGRRGSRESAASDDSTDSFEENGHHFIAFVPVGTKVWKLDGMDAQPTSVGTFDAAAGETWFSCASDTINTLMAAGDSDYGVLAVSQSPLSSLRTKAALITNELGLVESRLHEVNQTWDDCEAPHVALDLEQQLLSAHLVPTFTAALVAAEDGAGLLTRRSVLVEELGGVAANIAVEMEEEAAKQQKARLRRFDAGPVLKVWLEMLAGSGYLEENLGRFMP